MMSLPSRSSLTKPWTLTHMPGLTVLRIAAFSSFCMNFVTRTEVLKSVMSKDMQKTPGRRVSRMSAANTRPATTAEPILGFSAAMGETAPLMAPPMMTSSAFFSCLGRTTVRLMRTSVSP